MGCRVQPSLAPGFGKHLALAACGRQVPVACFRCWSHRLRPHHSGAGIAPFWWPDPGRRAGCHLLMGQRPVSAALRVQMPTGQAGLNRAPGQHGSGLKAFRGRADASVCFPAVGSWEPRAKKVQQRSCLLSLPKYWEAVPWWRGKNMG